MKTRITGLFAAAALLCLSTAPATAQDHSRNWDNGHVVQVTNVHIKPGMFNAYINDLNSLWRKSLEIQKKDGHVIGYGMYANPNAREGEPDLILTVTYKNWAAFDLGIEYFEKVSEQLKGSMEAMREASIDREDLRSIGTTMTLQEITFAD
ncbi:MAG: hypothetical protein P8172_08085 [Gammaproteobacteria bacterium]|jgi:hypothetical protein